MSLSRPSILRLSRLKNCFLPVFLGSIVVILAAAPATAKETPVIAIALFDGPSGPAYVQITGLTLNGKSELRVCDGTPKLNKTVYDTEQNNDFCWTEASDPSKMLEHN